MNIKNKFFLLAFQVFFALTLLAWLSIAIANQGFKHVTDVFSDSQQVQNLQSEYIEPLYNLREMVLSLVIAPNKTFRQNIKRNIKNEMEVLDKRFVALNTSSNVIWQHYKSLVLQTTQYVDKNFEEGAFINVTTVGRKQFIVLIDSLKELQNNRLEQSKETFLSAKISLKQNRVYVILSILLISVITFFIGYFISNNIISAINKVGNGLERFFRFLHNPKSKNTDIMISLDSQDELGKMASSINSEIELARKELENNYKFIEEITYILQEIKRDRLNNRLKLNTQTKEFNILKNVINELIDNLEIKIQTQINERMNQEKLLIQQSKLAEMGNMIGNIAHQWRQPLSEINAILLELQMSSMYDDLDEKYMVVQIKECFRITEYMSVTISDFQNFFQPSKQKEMFSILHTCNSAMSIIASSLKFHNIELDFDINEDQKVMGYSNEFAQALLNIMSNAKDILIERKIASPKIQVRVKKGKHYTVIRIEDNAGGIKLDNIEKVFEPYFTTKHAQKGIGIGLYMTKTIIENNMNGYVNVYNGQNGAVFTVKIK